MNTRRCEGRNAIRWITFVIQVLIVLIRVEETTTTTSVVTNVSTTPSPTPVPTIFSQQSNTSSNSTVALSPPASPASTPASAGAPKSSAETSSSVGPSPRGSSTVISNPPASSASTPASAGPPKPSAETSSSVSPSPSGSSTVISNPPASPASTPASAGPPKPSAETSSSVGPSPPGSSTVISSPPASSASTPASAGPPTSSAETSSSVGPSPSEPFTTGSPTPPVPTAGKTTTPPITPTNTAVPSVYIQMTFKMNWGRFCSLKSVFKESLSRDMIQMNGSRRGYLSTKRIKLMNADKPCSNRSYHNEQVILNFYISKSEVDSNTDKNKTIEAFELLYSYWTPKTMIMLDEVFEGKVFKVALLPDGPVRSIYIQMTFKMNWGRFCSFKSVFKESLSRDMIQMNGSRRGYLSTKRIKLMNTDKPCSHRSYYNEQVILNFYISKSEVDSNTDKNKTIEAFELLYSYWTAKTIMIMLDEVFEGKVFKVALLPDGVPPPVRSIYIQMTFKMNWGRFCSLKSVFKESLSRDMIQVNDWGWEYLSTRRIKLMNADKACSNTSYYNEEVILNFCISKSVLDSDTDKNTTIEAFKLLYRYWTTKTMIMLEKVFEGKVSKVDLIGVDADNLVAKDTEEQHIGIAIGIALAIIVVLLLIIHCVKSRLHKEREDRLKPEDKRMVFTNPVALDEDTANESGNADQPKESQAQPGEEPEEVVVHTPETEKSEPLLSAILDYEDGKKSDETKSDEEPGEGGAPLAKPDAEGEPIKPPDETKADAAPEPPKTEDEGTGQPSKLEDEDKPEDEEGLGERKSTFTSSLTLLITPEATSTPQKFDFPEKGDDEKAPIDTGDESAKPDFEQSDNSAADPTEGAINLGFEVKDEEPDTKKEPEEETKF